MSLALVGPPREPFQLAEWLPFIARTARHYERTADAALESALRSARAHSDD
jgi:hypothetical protein